MNALSVFDFDPFIYPVTPFRFPLKKMNYKRLVESPQIRGIKSLHVGIDVMLTENNCTHHNNINADLKTNLFFFCNLS